MLPIFFFDPASTKNIYKVEHEWQWRKNKILHEKDIKSKDIQEKRYLFYLQNSFSQRILDSIFSQTE